MNNKILKMFIKSIKAVVLKEKILFTIACIVSLINSLSWCIGLWTKQILFDNATKYVNGKDGIETLIFSIVFVGGISVLGQLANGADVLIYNFFTQKCRGKMSREIHSKLKKLTPILFEDVEKLELIRKAEWGRDSCISFVLGIKDVFFFYIPYFFFIGSYMFALTPKLVVCVLVVFIPILLAQIARVKVYQNYADEAIPYKRKAEYFENCIVDREFFKETHILGAVEFFFQKWYFNFSQMLKLRYKAVIKAKKMDFLLQMFTVVSYSIIFCVLVCSLLSKEITIGSFVAIFSGLASMYGVMKAMICYRISGMADNMGIVQGYFDFFELEEEIKTTILEDKFESIELKNVSFKYPEKNSLSIDSVSFSVTKGEVIAIVGENGAGKTTLVKILCGLYEPSEGKVLINGKDVMKIGLSSLRNFFSAVFQKYQRYQMTLENNIVISDSKKKKKEQLLDKILSQVNLRFNKFSEGRNTMISREFGTIDISGGEWQKIALARCFYRNKEVVVLDEPTSAIDPYEEKMMYEKFTELIKGKTAFIVTHRLASVKMADRIIVLEDGKMIEVGKHSELISAKGKYFELYTSQKKWYEKSN